MSSIDRVLFWVVVVVVATIALLSFVLSYLVMMNEARKAGVYWPELFPFIVDLGLVAFIATRLLSTIRGIQNARLWSLWAIVGATVTSILLNVAHAVDFGAWVWSADSVIGVVYFIIPPVALAICSELLAMLLHHTATHGKPKPTEAQRVVIEWALGEMDNATFADVIGVKPRTVGRWAKEMGL